MDFLGNPVGLLSDVASGVSGMIAVQPDVVGLVRDVAHGMSDTTSKVRRSHFFHIFAQLCVSIPLEVYRKGKFCVDEDIYIPPAMRKGS